MKQWYPSSLFIRASGIFCALFIIDRFTKIVAFFLFSEHAYPVIPGILRFSLLLHAKSYVILDFWRGEGIGIFSLILLCGAFFLLRREIGKAGPAYFVALICAGVISNFMDYVRYGAIVDWISIPGVTVFNLSDIFIGIGCLLLLHSFFKRNGYTDTVK